MKTLDDTLVGLSCCETDDCDSCPYEHLYRCRGEMVMDAHAHLKRLKKKADALMVVAQRCDDVCKQCKHYRRSITDEPCVHCGLYFLDEDDIHFEPWREEDDE